MYYDAILLDYEVQSMNRCAGTVGQHIALGVTFFYLRDNTCNNHICPLNTQRRNIQSASQSKKDKRGLHSSLDLAKEHIQHPK